MELYPFLKLTPAVFSPKNNSSYPLEKKKKKGQERATQSSMEKWNFDGK